VDEPADPPPGPDAATEIAQLRAALAHGDIIGMAKGLLMERFGVEPRRRSRYCARSANTRTPSSRRYALTWSTGTQRATYVRDAAISSNPRLGCSALGD
jgi:hypothetical protein